MLIVSHLANRKKKEVYLSLLTLTLIRGLPGSGKSALAEKMNVKHLETDMFFTNEQRRYQFDDKRLTKAQLWCQQQCEQYLSQKKSVVIANTFVKYSEMDVYRLLAKKHRASLSVVACLGECSHQHKISQTKLLNMNREWQC